MPRWPTKQISENVSEWSVLRPPAQTTLADEGLCGKAVAPPAATAMPVKTRLFEALNAAYAGSAVSIMDYPPGHSKLAARRLLHAHVGVRVSFPADDEARSSSYAIAGMVPTTASDADISELMARMADDYRRAQAVAIPTRPV